MRNIAKAAGALRVSVGLLLRRLRQAQFEGELTLTATALAKLEQIGWRLLQAPAGRVTCYTLGR